MKKFFYQLYANFKASWLFNTIIFVEILALIIVAGMFMQTADLTDVKRDGYNADYAQAVIMSVKELEDRQHEDGFENYAVAKATDDNGITISVINPLMAQMFKVPHSGAWYSNTVDAQYAEALVSPEFKDKYVKGELYEIDGFEYKRKIKVVGYLGKESIALELRDPQYVNQYNVYDMMICDNMPITDATALPGRDSGQAVITIGYDKQHYIDNFNANADYLGDSYEIYADSQYYSNYYTQYLVLLIFAMVIVGVLCNSIFRTEHNIRRNTIKYIVGNKPRSIMAAEIVSALLLFLVPFVIDLIIVAVVNSASLMPFISWRGFGIASVIVFGVYVLSVSVGLVRTLMAKPLKELRK